MLLTVPVELALSLPSVEPGHYVPEKNLHADAMVRSDPFPGFRVSNREQLRLPDQFATDGTSISIYPARVGRIGVIALMA